MIGTGTSGVGAPSSGVVKAALIAGGVFLAWKAAKGARDLGWSLFGLSVAAYWTGFWPF